MQGTVPQNPTQPKNILLSTKHSGEAGRQLPEYMTEDFMGQLVDVVFGLTGSLDQFPFTIAP